MQILKLGYEVALQIQDAEMLAKMTEGLDFFYVGLVERQLLERRKNAGIVFCTLHSTNDVSRDKGLIIYFHLQKQSCLSNECFCDSDHPLIVRFSKWIFVQSDRHVEDAEMAWAADVLRPYTTEATKLQ